MRLQLVSQRLGEVALVTEEFVPYVARREPARQNFAPVIDDQVELEALKPAHGGFAPSDDPHKDLVARNPFVVAHLEGGGIHEGDASALTVALLQVSRFALPSRA